MTDENVCSICHAQELLLFRLPAEGNRLRSLRIANSKQCMHIMQSIFTITANIKCTGAAMQPNCYQLICST